MMDPMKRPPSTGDPERDALINRLGFNNGGLEAFIANVKKAQFRNQANPLLLGLNIGKNATTPNDKAIDDYTAQLIEEGLL